MNKMSYSVNCLFETVLNDYEIDEDRYLIDMNILSKELMPKILTPPDEPFPKYTLISLNNARNPTKCFNSMQMTNNLKLLVPDLDGVFGQDLKDEIIVIVGELCLNTTNGYTTKYIDVYFLRQPTSEFMMKKIASYISVLSKGKTDEITITKHSIQYGKIQFMLLTNIASIGVLLSNIDMPCCRIAYNGEGFLTTPGGLMTLETGICVITRTNHQLVDEILKYAKYGFKMLFPFHKINTSIVGNQLGVMGIILEYPFMRVSENEMTVPGMNYLPQNMVGQIQDQKISLVSDDKKSMLKITTNITGKMDLMGDIINGLGKNEFVIPLHHWAGDDECNDFREKKKITKRNVMRLHLLYCSKKDSILSDTQISLDAAAAAETAAATAAAAEERDKKKFHFHCRTICKR
jgi:hypothetical protein